MKLSKRLSKRLAFLASELALSIDQDERMALLTELLDELGINDPEQREDSKDSAARHLRYTAQQQRDADHDALRRRIDELYARRDALLAERAEQQPTETTPEPAPTVEEAPTYTVTASQRRALARFDDMTDADQVDSLRGMWGCTDGR